MLLGISEITFVTYLEGSRWIRPIFLSEIFQNESKFYDCSSYASLAVREKHKNVIFFERGIAIFL